MSYETPTQEEIERRMGELAAAEEAAEHAMRDGYDEGYLHHGYEAHCLTERIRQALDVRDE